jgi:hypothetical protein
MSDQPARDWWELVEEHLVRGDHLVDDGDAETHDPWSDAGASPTLTDAQRELLAGIDDQPGVARFDHHEHEHDQPPVPRFARLGEADGEAPDDDRHPGSTTGNIPGDSP